MSLWEFLNNNQIWGLAYLILILFTIIISVSLLSRKDVIIMNDDDEEEDPVPSEELN
jgi:predicted ABC-type sugar transport system permease subunit